MKRLLIILFLLLITGCSTSLNTPTGSVEKYLNRYQNLDKEVLNQLDSVMINNSTMSEEQRKEC